MKKYLASDIDGTLLKHNNGSNQERSVLEKDIQAIEFFTKQHTLIISTGRNKISTFQLFDRLNQQLTHMYYITSNGAQIFDSDLRCIFQMTLKQEIAEQSLRLFYCLNTHSDLLCSVFDGEKIYLLENQEDTQEIPDLSKIINICVESKNKNICDIQPFFNQAKTFDHCEVHQNNWYVDIVPQNISKAFAIHFIIDLDSEKESYLLGAVGDSWNDIPMFEIADESYTFHQSPTEVKQKATHHIDHVYQCIADFLEK